MKKFASALIASLLIYTVLTARDYQSRSFMFTRPAAFNTAAHQHLWNFFLYGFADSSTSYVQAIPLLQRSCPSAKVARYFLFNGQNTLSVYGDDAGYTNVANRDLRAEWIGLSNNFGGQFSICPRQRQTGCIIDGTINLPGCSPGSFMNHLWIGFELPFFCVKNDICLSQETFTPGTGALTTIGQALNQNDWEFSKLGSTQCVSGATELRLKLGIRIKAEHGFQVGGYTGVLIPFSHKANPAYLFSPYLGFNKHYGFITAVSFQLPMTENECPFSVHLFANVENIYLFANTQQRTMDLWNKPWSRYLLFRRRGQVEDVTIPGVNILTRTMHVSAYNMADASFGFRLSVHGVCAEMGYSVFARSEEHLCLKDCWEPIYGIAGTGINQSASQSTIKCLINDPPPDGPVPPDPDANPCAPYYNANFVVVEQTDLALQSAAAAASFTQRGHIALGYEYELDSATVFYGIGAFAEVPHNNASLKLIGCWFKLGVMF